MNSKREKELMVKLVNIKIGENFKFIVTEVNDDYALSTLVNFPEITGKVDYNVYFMGHTFNPYEHFEVGDEFEGKVLSKEIKRTLLIKPTLNLLEVKNKKSQNDLLEKWKRNEL